MRYSVATVCVNSAMMASIGTALAWFYFRGAWRNIDMSQPTPSPYCTWEQSYFECIPTPSPPSFTCLAPSESFAYQDHPFDSLSLALGLSNWKLFGLIFGAMSILFAINIFLHDIYVLNNGGPKIWLLSSPQAADLNRILSHPQSLFPKTIVTIVWLVAYIPSLLIAPLMIFIRVPRHLYASLTHPLLSSYINSMVCLGVLLITSMAMLIFAVWTYYLGAALFQKRQVFSYKITFNSTLYMLYISAAAIVKCTQYIYTLYHKGANFVFSVQHHVPHPSATYLNPDDPAYNLYSFSGQSPLQQDPNRSSPNMEPANRQSTNDKSTNDKSTNNQTSQNQSTNGQSTTGQLTNRKFTPNNERKEYDLRKNVRKKNIYDL